MAVQSQIISCAAGQWTSIAEYMDRRQSLMVQCPQIATTITGSNAAFLNDGALHTIAAADSNRRGMMIACGPLDATSTSGSFGPSGAAFYALDPTDLFPVVVSANDADWGAAVKSVWQAIAVGDGSHAIPCAVSKETYGCSTIVLGIKTGVPTYAGPYGTVPVGIWQTPDLLSGPSEFRLSRAADYDLTIQEWFAWPVGSGNVSVQVYQSFDDTPVLTDNMYGTFEVGLPKLSEAGKRHLNRLRERVSGTERDRWLP